jgi:uncharacterized membrane protein YcjF (UPF0283 family)
MTVLRWAAKWWVEILAVLLLLGAAIIGLSADYISNSYTKSQIPGLLSGIGGAVIWFLVMGLAVLCLLVGLACVVGSAMRRGLRARSAETQNKKAHHYTTLGLG